MRLNHPRTTLSNPVHRKIVFHKTSRWCQKHWGLLLYKINSKPLLFTYKTENLNFCSSLTHTLVSSQRQSVALGTHSIPDPRDPTLAVLLHMRFPLPGISFPTCLVWLTLVHLSRLSTDIARAVDPTLTAAPAPQQLPVYRAVVSCQSPTRL